MREGSDAGHESSPHIYSPPTYWDSLHEYYSIYAASSSSQEAGLLKGLNEPVRLIVILHLFYRAKSGAGAPLPVFTPTFSGRFSPDHSAELEEHFARRERW